ncbi:MAG: GNAT family N-acetyltransferase [Halohasta sp.]
MEFAVLGWPADEPRLRLDYRRFSYAGKFVTATAGIAVVRGDPPADSDSADADSLPPLPEGLDADAFVDDILAAVAFNADRTDSQILWLRYLTVRDDLRGSGLELGPRLAAFLLTQAAEREYRRARIAVNNAFSYHALYKAGFAFGGRETGLAELILERPVDEPASTAKATATTTYQQGLDVFREREGLSAAERAFLDAKDGAEPPEPIAVAVDSGGSNSRRPSG